MHQRAEQWLGQCLEGDPRSAFTPRPGEVVEAIVMIRSRGSEINLLHAYFSQTCLNWPCYLSAFGLSGVYFALKYWFRFSYDPK